MADETVKMKPIWYYVGWILLIIGCIVLLSGIYYWFVPSHHRIELPNLHIDIWWGLILMIGGGVLIDRNRHPLNLE